MRKCKSCRTQLIIFIAVLLHLTTFGQIYTPEGLNVPGSWDTWINPPQNLVFAGEAQTSGGLVQLKALGTPIYQTRFSVSVAGGNITAGEYQFKFTSGPLTGIWQNQWGGVDVQINQTQTYTYGVASSGEPAHNTITLANDRFYVMNWNNTGYSNTRAIFMELSESPAEILSVTQNPMMPGSTDPVEILVEADGSPAPEEHIFVRYTTDNWASSQLAEAQFTGATGTAIIPAQDNGTTVNFYVFSSVITEFDANHDFLTINYENNGGDNFDYTVGDSLVCGSTLALISTQPAFPLHNSDVILTFNADLGNGGLAGYEGEVYVHTGVITSESTGTSDWKYVKTDWGENTPETHLTRISDNLYELQIANIREYYGVPANEEILQVAMVFRSDEPVNGTAYLEGKTSDNQDIFAEVYADELQVKITYPVSDNPLLDANSLVPVCVATLQADSVQLFIDDSYLASATDESLLYGLNTSTITPGSHFLIAKAHKLSEQKTDTVVIYLRNEVLVEALPEGAQPGVNYLNGTSATLVLSDPAAQKDFVFVLGDFNNWQVNEYAYMKRTPDGNYFWITLTNLEPQKEYAYQFYIDGNLKIADPYTHKILDPWNDKWIPEETYPDLLEYPFGKTTGIVSVLQTNQPEYDWQVENFIPSAIHETQSNLVIYELLIRDFVGDSRIASVTDSLDYLKNLGITAIELMPVNEFEGNDSWGYNPSFYFAPDKAYGTQNDYKAFVDACHARGIAVILDVVFNHSFGQSPMVQMYWNAATDAPSAQNPWYNQIATHPLSPGYDFNHESPHTRQFFKDVLSYWMNEYKIDGFRFDLSKGFTQTNSGSDEGYWSQYDQSRVNILTDYYNHIKTVDVNSYLILEHLSDNSEEAALANTGMLPWGKMTNEFNQATMGWQDNSDFSWAYYNERGFTYPNLIPFMESHDEERLMVKNLEYGNSTTGYDVQDLSTALSRQSAVAPMFFMVPGPKMIWQFGELGYDYSINYCPDGTISEDCRTSKKPVRWDYFSDLERQTIYKTFAAMAQLKTSQQAFIYGNYGKDLGGMVKRAWVSHSSLNVCAATNFDVVSHTVNPGFQHTGTWVNYFTGETLQADANTTIELQPGEFYVFTDQNLGRPFVNLTVKVIREEDQTPIVGARVYLEDLGEFTTNGQGEVAFLPFSNRGYNYRVVAGTQQKTGTIAVSADDQTEIIAIRSVDGLTENPESRIGIYPNPATNYFTVLDANGFEMSIYSLQGQLLYEKPVNKAVEKISVSELPAGVYLIKFRNENYFFNDKLIIK